MHPDGLSFDMAPHRLSGVVYGTLLNDGAALAALGDAVHQAPYKAPPKAPVLYVKPRNTLAASGARVAVPPEGGEFEIGAALGLVVGRTACRVSEAQALSHLAGYVIVADLSLPHDSFYRPSIRFKARDGSCLIGPQVTPRADVPDPDALGIDVLIDGRIVQHASTAGMRRHAAALLADVTEFMTLRPGDILLLGVPAGAPRARAGQTFAIEIDGLGRLDGTLVAEEEGT
ncbi:MAG TPA: fumarylacetoacetate hydrolase family protein [Burkholderiaceae bacterium]|nr:fumarylacetoacetate hydrolase family protein [Burkholderiaceae bacterium]